MKIYWSAPLTLNMEIRELYFANDDIFLLQIQLIIGWTFSTASAGQVHHLLHPYQHAIDTFNWLNEEILTKCETLILREMV